MKQDNEIDQFFLDASKVNLNEEIPSVFLSDLNSRLDALEKKRRKPVAFWWIVSVFSLSLFTWGATLLFNSTNENPNLTKKAYVVKVKSTETNKAANSATKESQNKIASSNVYSTKNQKINDEVKNKVITRKSKKTESTQSTFETKSNTNSKLKVNDVSIDQGKIKSKIEDSKSTAVNEIKNVDSTVKNEVIQIVDSAKTIDSVLTNQTVEKVELVKEKKKPSIQKEIGLFFGVSGITSSFSIPKELENSVITTTLTEYRETREREEISTSSWDFSLRMKWITNGISVQTGLDYFQWGEQIKYSYNSISGINRYSYLNVPINIGYAKTWGKFGINPFAGVMLGYGFNRSGNYLQPDLNSIAQAESKKYIANYQLGCEFFFLSESKYKFSLIPLYRASFKDVIYTDVIRNRYKSIGLQIGISYDF
jgi:hypothetical protein